MGKLKALAELFEGRHFDREVIILCVRWYLRFKLSLRDLVEMTAERGLSMAHTTIMRWVQRYAPEFEKRWRRFARKATARAFGEAFRQIGVPVGEAYTSQFNRAYETAVLAGFQDIVKSVDITEGGLVVSPNENDRRTAAFRKLLAVAPKPGTDTVIITHKPNIVDALGKDWFDVREGEASIFKPEGDSYKLVARVQMDEWPRIAAAK